MGKQTKCKYFTMFNAQTTNKIKLLVMHMKKHIKSEALKNFDEHTCQNAIVAIK